MWNLQHYRNPYPDLSALLPTQSNSSMPRSLFSRASSSHKSTWEAVEHQEIAPVSIYSGSTIRITPLSTEFVSHTYIINTPSSVSPVSSLSSRSPSPAPSTIRRPRSVLAAYIARPFSRSRSFASIKSIDTASVSSYSGSEATYDPERTPRTSTTSLLIDDAEAKYEQIGLQAQQKEERDTSEPSFTIRDALIFARDQLTCSPEVKSLGGNVLAVEGWSVTRLQSGNQDRVQIRYYGQPARAVFPSSSSRKLLSLPRNRPPSIDILRDSWF
ncbi:hypothetical protein FRB94_003208 [Tulasnella sp. JGI-2019a]|nr:hypothetical protein FRB94_003208 [Tulasnella sp. JGI-2019a]